MNTRGNFTGADGESADFSAARLHGTRLAGASLAGASFREADLSDANFEHATIRGGDFTAARPLWARALELSPANAPYRAEIAERLRLLDAFLTQGRASGAQ